MHYGFFTGKLLIKPYINVMDLRDDLEAGVIPDATRRTTGNDRNDEGLWIIPVEQVEPYYRSKKYIPESIINKKLAELGLLGPTTIEAKKKPVNPQMQLSFEVR